MTNLFSSELDNSLRTYAESVYALSGVAELCLRMQDEYGVDVNLLLTACWLGDTGRALNADRLSVCLRASEELRRDIVLPIRTLRRQLKAVADEALYRQCKELELMAEYRQLALLHALCCDWTGQQENSAELLAANIQQYLSTLKLPDQGLVLGGELAARIAARNN